MDTILEIVAEFIAFENRRPDPAADVVEAVARAGEIRWSRLGRSLRFGIRRSWRLQQWHMHCRPSEDHDTDWARGFYLRYARAALTVMPGQGERDAIVDWLATDAASCADDLRKLHAAKKLTPMMTAEWEAMIAAKSGVAAAIQRGEHLQSHTPAKDG
jgi:hypothetical protein